ncbi:MAG: hypothetical protein JNL98_39430 [Bryobacterales bacterium]|nr:hypothetical protein [Bryobacterales bacterium]
MTRKQFLVAITSAVACVPAFGGFRGSRVKVRRLARLTNQAESQSTGVLEFTVTSEEAFPIRAIDPVLRVGREEISGYRYENSKTLVFKSIESDTLQDGAQMVLQFGNDEDTRTDLGRFRRAEISQ